MMDACETNNHDNADTVRVRDVTAISKHCADCCCTAVRCESDACNKSGLICLISVSGFQSKMQVYGTCVCARVCRGVGPYFSQNPSAVMIDFINLFSYSVLTHTHTRTGRV